MRDLGRPKRLEEATQEREGKEKSSPEVKQSIFVFVVFSSIKKVVHGRRESDEIARAYARTHELRHARAHTYVTRVRAEMGM